MRWAFDSDVLIYASAPGHTLGGPVARLVSTLDIDSAIGSVLLLPALLTRPTRRGDGRELADLRAILSGILLLDVSEQIASRAVELGANVGLKLADAVHLATAIHGGADRFLTINSRDFKPGLVREIEVVYPTDL